MANKLSRIRSALKNAWHYTVGFSNIISCIISIISCYIAYTAVMEIYYLNIEVAPIIEKFNTDSIIVVEKPADPIPEHSNTSDNQPNNTTDTEPTIKSTIESKDSLHLSSETIDGIRDRRDAFIKKMQLLFGR